MGVGADGSTAPSPVRAARRGLVVLLGALSAFGPLCLDMYLPALPALPDSLHGTVSGAQLSLSAAILGLGGGQLIVGPLSDRLGRRLPLLAGLMLFVLTSAACAITTSMTLFVLLRLLQGAAGAAGVVISRAAVADRFTGTRAATVFATIAVVNGLAPILAPVLGAQILRLGSWRTVFWVLAGIGVVLLVAAALIVDESLPVARRTGGGLGQTLAGFRTLIGDRMFVGWALAGTLVTAAMFGYISASPFLLQDGFGLSAAQFSFCFGANALGIVALSQLGRMLLRRFTPAALLTWAVGQCLAGAAVLALALAVGWGLFAVLAGLFVMVSAVGLALPFASVLAMDRHREIAGSASALLGTLQYALGAITAPLVGLGDRTAGTALWITAVVCSAGAGVAALGARRASETSPPA